MSICYKLHRHGTRPCVGLQTQSSQGHEAELRRLGQQVVECCRDAGLTVQWTGDAEDMIVIKVALTVVSSH